jgi:hypothetical protein
LFGVVNCARSHGPAQQTFASFRFEDLIDNAELFSAFEIEQLARRHQLNRFRLANDAHRRCVPPVPGSTPSETSGSPILPAPFRAMRMSAAIATSKPPPTQWPLIAAITSFGVCSNAKRFVGVQAEIVFESRA